MCRAIELKCESEISVQIEIIEFTSLFIIYNSFENDMHGSRYNVKMLSNLRMEIRFSTW